VNDIDDYIRANRDRFAREALDAKLRASGHDQAAIDAAWARAGSGEGAPDGPRQVTTGARVGAILLILVAIGGYVFLGFVGTAGISFVGYDDHVQGASGGVGGPYQIILLAYLVAMVVGLAISIRSLWRAPRIRGTGAAVFGAIGLSLLLLIGINGVCFVATSAVNAANGGSP
jgi:hypothetical protein